MKFSELVSEKTRLSLPSDPDIGGIASDSEKAAPGCLFVCIDGMHSDGHSFIDEAASRGAAAFVISQSHPEAEERLTSAGMPFAVYADTREAEAVITSRFFGDPWKDMKIFAVTGTNGKTTVVSLLDAIFQAAGYSCRTVGTLTGRLTTPDPAVLYPALRSFADSGTQYVFMEASSHALALGKLTPIRFACGIFTNLTPEHLDFHGDMEHYAGAKAKLFASSDRAVINADDCRSQYMAEKSHSPLLCSVKRSDTDFYAKNITNCGVYGIRYDLMTTDLVFKIRSGIPGLFNVMNTMEAAAAALSEGISPEVIRGAVCGFSGVRGRLERVRLPTNDFAVYIDFAHTPDALENILLTVRQFSGNGRIVVLFGCGGDRDRTKRPAMGAVAARLSDFAIITADNSRSERTEDIISEILSGITSEGSYTVIPDRKEAIYYAIATARKGDMILLCGKGHEEYEIMPDGIHPFSEKETAQNACAEYLRLHGEF